ncbi:spore gernimation protein [Bacillus sonorensis]|uniref:spore germination protein n=1 Tax=Bacillus sonorensis TaxID=119858 RepID=UPI0018CE7908|nr:spore germination protein [Bacillus sonorensis]MBG9914003.1 spore gernimation protein [Bacillus sonorensis]
MPAMVGPILIREVNDNSAIFVGDVFAISPKTTQASEIGGCGGFNVGDFGLVHNKRSITSFKDSDVFDATQGFNA